MCSEDEIKKWEMIMEPLLLRPVEAAKTLAISRSRIYELIAEGAIESVRIGHSVRVPRKALHSFIARNSSGTTHEIPPTNN